MEIDLTPILQALIGLIAALITLKIIPWIQARTTAAQYNMLLTATRVAVFAAEQIFGAGGGKEKLMYVKGELAKKGYKVDIDAIESMVMELKLQKPPDEGIIQPKM